MQSLIHQETFHPEHQAILITIADAFMKLQPQTVLHYVKDSASPHQERDLLSHTIFAMQALLITDRYAAADVTDRFRMLLTTLVHDVGKALQWPAIDTSTPWNFRGHDTVGASWFWNQVKHHQWDQHLLRPVFLAVWFHMVKAPENQGLIYFLHQHGALHIVESLFCADNYGRLEMQAQLTSPLIVPSIPTSVMLPHLPIVVYILGRSGSGKTTLARRWMEEMPDVSTGYVAFDRALLRTLSNNNTPWADMDPAVRGPNFRVKSPYSAVYDQYQRYPAQRELVRKAFSEDFKQSIATVEVTFLTSTVNKPSFYTLPFMSQRFLSVVTSPDDDYFSQLRLAMEATRRGPGWAAPGALLFVPEREVISAIRHLLASRSFQLNPPTVNTVQDLVPLFTYWKDITGSLDGMKSAIESFYEISVSYFTCRQGVYYNFAYRDGASYDDPFHPGFPSPATFCRGTTFYYNGLGWACETAQQDNYLAWECVRLPMCRGREIAFTPIAEAEAEDTTIPTIFYSNLLANGFQNKPILTTAKVDGALLIVFRDRYGVENNHPSLYNTYQLLFGTKAMVVMTPEITQTFLRSLTAMNHTVESFSRVCSEYMDSQMVFSLAFEMVAEKRSELVVEYSPCQQGLYFLGASSEHRFRPFYEYGSHPCRVPEVKSFDRLEEITSLVLGPFPDHLEGSVIWVQDETNSVQSGSNSVQSEPNWYPLKLKTSLYYLLHKKRAHAAYNDYLIQLGTEYGWHAPIPIQREQLADTKICYSLFALVNLPATILEQSPVLRRRRESYDILMASNEEDHQRQCRFNTIYRTGTYQRAYELV